MLLFVANTEYICFSTKAVCLTPFGAYVQSLRAQKELCCVCVFTTFTG